MNRTELAKRLNDTAADRADESMHQPVDDAPLQAPFAETSESTDLFVWFEDTRVPRSLNGNLVRLGIAGLPESMLPYSHDNPASLRVIERRYAEGHLHLLSAVRLRCTDKFGEKIASIYTAALSVGTVAWIGTGAQYERAWGETAPAAE